MGFQNPLDLQYVRDDAAISLKLPISFASADGALLFALPSDAPRVAIERIFWEVITGFTGGSSSAIGVSTNQTGLSTKGDLLGGASGDVAATLVAGFSGGTIGAKYDSNGIVILKPGSALRFDRITSAFLAGAGFVHVLARQIK